jgi:hypothetical protein
MRVMIVGVCSSGKTTLEQGLKSVGYDALTCAQEHSYVPSLWQSGMPDLLICLDASLQTLRSRGELALDDGDLAMQRQALAHARQHADLFLKTDHLNAEEVLRKARRFVERRQAECPRA